ncbi:MAG: hypothetical protein AMXMBFR55_25110 [Gemmatimonadota bacterium]
MGPETRLSRPTTTVRDDERASENAPNAAANWQAISGVSASPTRPLTPDTLTINPSNVIDHSVHGARKVAANLLHSRHLHRDAHHIAGAGT